VLPARHRRLVARVAVVLIAAACGAPTSTATPSPVASPPSSAASARPPAVTDTPAPSASGDAAVPPDPTVFAYDASRPLDPEVTRRREAGDTTVEHVTFGGGDGERVPALFTIPRRADGPTACILLGHGFRGDKSQLPVGDLLARAGFASFGIDARFHGERRDPEVLAAMATEPSLLARMLRETVIDMRRAIDYLETRPECDSSRIGFLGASMGGFVGSLVAGADARVQAPVLLVSGADWPTMLESTEARDFRRVATAGDIAAARAVLDPVDPKHWVGRIAPRPVLMIAGDADAQVPPASARALHAAAREPKQVLWYSGGHAFPAERERTRIVTTIALWLTEHLGGP
jgi:uncharacterized protein